MMQSLPSREELIRKLDGLCAGTETREQVAEWAVSIIDDGDVRVTDKVAWRVLEGLGAADLPAPDRGYLYTTEDFKEWKAELIAD